jgi:hypothetical protein
VRNATRPSVALLPVRAIQQARLIAAYRVRDDLPQQIVHAPVFTDGVFFRVPRPSITSRAHHPIGQGRPMTVPQGRREEIPTAAAPRGRLDGTLRAEAPELPP